MSGDVPQGAPFEAWRQRPMTPAEFSGASPRERLLQLAELALLAPSTHNTVPVRFQLREPEAALVFCLDRAAILPESDSVGRQATVSLGCAIENARLGAGCLGVETRLDIDQRAGEELRPVAPSANPGVKPGGERRYVPVATLKLAEPTEPWPAVWLECIQRRKVVRAEYDERVKVDPELAAKLLRQITTTDPRLSVHWMDDVASRSFLGKHQEAADAMALNRPAFARELGEWLLPNDSDSFVGMSGHEFGLSEAAAKRMHDGLCGRERLLPDELAGVAKSGNLLMRSASAVVVISVAEDGVGSRLAAGQAYERLAILLAERGYCTALHAALVELEAPSMALRGRLRTRARPTVVFRIGRPLHAEDGQRPHSARPPLRSLLLGDA